MSAKKKAPPKKKRQVRKNYPREIHARFAAWFKKVRERRGETLSDVARVLGVVTAVVSRWESEKTLPSSYLIARIARWAKARPDTVVDMLDIDAAKAA